MEEDPNKPHEQYQRLIEELHTLQETIDRESPVVEEGFRHVVGNMRELFNLEAEIYRRQNLGDRAGVELDVMIANAKNERQGMIPFLRMNSNYWLDRDLSVDFELPEVATLEWYGIFVYVTILSDLSRQVEFPPDPTEDSIPAEDTDSTEDPNPTPDTNPTEDSEPTDDTSLTEDAKSTEDAKPTEDAESAQDTETAEDAQPTANPAEEAKVTEDTKPTEEDEDDGPECGICAEKYEPFDIDVSFPCDERHRLCCVCLKNMHCWQLVIFQNFYCRADAANDEPVEKRYKVNELDF
ncbi:hypothetical protein DFH28DRAFT_1068375 [Melampsora americana]|nr:hypothetical protein DFH28DRAFT_1068375 [Melampsora americana]